MGDRIVSINGETPTTAKPSFAILQGIATGTTLKLEFASTATVEQPAVSKASSSIDAFPVSTPDPTVKVAEAKRI